MPDIDVNDPGAIPEPVRKKAAIQGLAVAVLNLIGILAEMNVTVLASCNLLIGAAIAYYDVFFLQKKVVPTEGLHDRLEALAPEVPPKV